MGVALRVTTRREAAYDVTIRVVPPCAFLQEASEPNDAPATAAPLGEQPAQGQLCPGDTDWYAYDLQAGDSLFVDLELGPDLDRQVPAQAEMTLVEADSGLVVAEGVAEGSL
ncbi:MAG: hypothetical protein R3E66_09470 [bacterium]